MDSYFDAHTHLQMIKDLPGAMERAQKAGVHGFICNATKEEDWQRVLNIAVKYAGIYPSLGVHPWYIDELVSGWEKRLEERLFARSDVMVGEIGLDAKKPNLDWQEEIFCFQFDLAAEFKRPVHIHCVGAWDKMMHIFKSRRQALPPKILVHSFAEKPKLAQELIEKYGAYISYSALFARENRQTVRDSIKATRLDKLLIESDAPDALPEPADLPGLVQKMAVVTGHKEEVLKAALYNNAKEFVNGR